MTMKPWKGPERSGVWGLGYSLLFFLGLCLWSWAAIGMFQEKTKSTLIPLNKLSKSLHFIFSFER